MRIASLCLILSTSLVLAQAGGEEGFVPIFDGKSFAGWKASGSTGKGGLGPYYVPQFMREQSQTVVVGDGEPDDAAGE